MLQQHCKQIKKTNMSGIKKYLLKFAGVLMIALIAAACNKTFKNNLEPGDLNVGQKNYQRKVLFIMIDGGVGNEVRTMNLPILNSLGDYSVYSWDAISEPYNLLSNNAMSWSTTLTGVYTAKHAVTQNDFAGSNQLTKYPSIFTRLKQEAPALKTASYTSNNKLGEVLAADANTKKSFAGDDAALKNSYIADVKAGTIADMTVLEFNSLDRAGLAGAYKASDAGYRQAMLTIDGYIGEILDVLKTTPNFNNENWMIIIASNKGSQINQNPSGGSWSAFDDSRNNTFFFCYNHANFPRFKSLNPAKPTFFPYAGASQFYATAISTNASAKVVDGGSLYDIGATGSYTIQCKVKMPTGTNNYPAFLGKRASFTQYVPGWVLFNEGNYWQVNFGQTTLGNRQIRGHAIRDGLWHTLTVVIKQVEAARYVYTYTDGVMYPGIADATRNIASYGNLNSPQPLTVGCFPLETQNMANFLVTDIRIYNTALPDDYIATKFCQTAIEDNDPYKNNVIGYWPSNDVVTVGGVTYFPDKSSNGKRLVVDKVQPATFNDASSNVCPPISMDAYRSVPNTVDIPYQILQWFGISINSAWGLDGRGWAPLFNDLK